MIVAQWVILSVISFSLVFGLDLCKSLSYDVGLKVTFGTADQLEKFSS